MIHLIYIYLCINCFITGLLKDDLEDINSLFKRIWCTVFFIVLISPMMIVVFLFQSMKLWINNSFIGNIMFTMRVKKGKVEITDYCLEITQKGSEAKLSKKRKSFQDKIYIWGAEEIKKAHERQQINTK